MSRLARALAAVALLAAAASAARAQIVPNADWQTITTAHFRVHFTPSEASLARRAAANAETAYAQLSRELHPPRGMIDLVVADNVDFTNGYATPFPTNRIVVYANPPVNTSSLRFTDDPDAMVITHELTHVFHLDRARGIWGLAQRVFGRAPYLFPDEYTPSWLTEGLAVYYESKLTGAGRVFGSDHHMIARAFAEEHRFPTIDQISLADARFPYGTSVYVFGSLFMDYLARTRGDHMRAFVESESSQLIPLWLDRPARQAFGISFTDAWRRWRDSLTRAAPQPSLPAPGWRYLTAAGGIAAYPRWADDTAIVYTGTTGRDNEEAYSVTLDGTVTRVERRNTDSPTLLGPGNERYFTQLEFTDPYHVRSDLFVHRGGETVRLTRGARLTVPDRRADGKLVAVQTLPGTTRLVTLAWDGTEITPLTAGTPDEQWTEPRWSPDGTHIAAALWRRGGNSEIVVIDTTGRIVQRISPAHAIQAAPSWSPDGRRIYFTSDRSGVTQIYSAPFAPGDTGGVDVVTSTTTGIFYPGISPDGQWLTGSVVLGDGYHVGIAPVSRLAPAPAPPLPPRAEPQPPEPVDSVTTAATPYSPWRSLWPRYWMPVEEPSIAGGARLGAFTSGADIVGRHAYDAQLFVPTDNTGLTGFFDYVYAGLGMPLLGVSGYQDWENYAAIRDDRRQVIGTLRKRTRYLAVGPTWTRPRYRTNGVLSLAAALEARDYAPDPAPLAARIDTAYRRTTYYPTLVASGGWSDAQLPYAAVSPEDGVSAAFTLRERFTSGNAARNTLSAVAVTTAYRSLDLGGFAHHVIALYGAAGFEDDQATDYLELGGVSGSTISLAPGVALGEGRRTFPVRGFQPATLVGTRALAGSIEYRMPLALADRGYGLLPFFLGRSSLSAFYDVGTAWCAAVLPQGSVCRDPLLANRYVLSSAGAELTVEAAVLDWDHPYQFRAGVAFPWRGRALVGARQVVSYLSLGFSF
ncbi:MAG: PD40 domain-containing protein [Gemmatimonadota bacterium]|nr:PD40 domain-containing protein [Gemmatimonadota bacterium]